MWCWLNNIVYKPIKIWPNEFQHEHEDCLVPNISTGEIWGPQTKEWCCTLNYAWKLTQVFNTKRAGFSIDFLDITKSNIGNKSKIDNFRLYKKQGYNQEIRKAFMKCNEIVTCRFYKGLKQTIYKELLHFINKKLI